ncbi:MAG: hypothetical protein GTO63_28865 [Anaerolineae bacterium]|nr:hypothetical protein [Anaerolineae bacterium]NIQ81667.1 hypothetical protein [Anaerolineae bacterium]
MIEKAGKAAMAFELAKWCTQYGLPQVISCFQETMEKKFGRQIYVVVVGGKPYIFHGSGTKEHFSAMWKESKKESLKHFEETKFSPAASWVIENILERMQEKGFTQAEYVWLTKS